jgi:hypothetical protein
VSALQNFMTEVKAAVGDRASPQAIADTEWFFDLLERSNAPALRDLHNRISNIATWQASLKIRWFAVQAVAIGARQALRGHARHHPRAGDTI